MDRYRQTTPPSQALYERSADTSLQIHYDMTQMLETVLRKIRQNNVHDYMMSQHTHLIVSDDGLNTSFACSKSMWGLSPSGAPVTPTTMLTMWDSMRWTLHCCLIVNDSVLTESATSFVK